MGIGDGAVTGTTKIVDNGSPASRWNLVLVGDGYQAAQMANYANDAQSFVNALFGTPPFSDLIYLTTPLHRAINVYRVDVSSTDSGADDPAGCGGTGAARATYFDASFCNGGIRRLLQVNNTTVINVANAQVPQWHMVMALVNSTIYGGSGGQVATFSMAPGANEIGLHEMGHTAFGLADEYEYWAGCGTDTTNNNHPAAEPAEPNVTIRDTRATVKWNALIDVTTPVPTTSNANCAQCDPQPNPLPADTVGAYEGAHYYHCDCYRPQFDCRMRALGRPFCAVCSERIVETLRPFVPPISFERVLWRLLRLWWRYPPDPTERWRRVVDPSPMDLVRLGRVLAEGSETARPRGDALSEALERLQTLSDAEARELLLRVKSAAARLETAEKVLESQLHGK